MMYQATHPGSDGWKGGLPNHHTTPLQDVRHAHAETYCYLVRSLAHDTRRKVIQLLTYRPYGLRMDDVYDVVTVSDRAVRNAVRHLEDNGIITRSTYPTAIKPKSDDILALCVDVVGLYSHLE